MGVAYSGLGEVCARVDAWAVVEALGGREAAAVAPAEAWWERGLPRGTRPHDGPPGVPWLTPADPRWPARLGVPYGPLRLSWRGDLGRLAAPAVAIVGARACTAYGRAWAARLAVAVRDAGGVVVSGLARGVDAAAHEAAEGATVAVLGSGLHHPMPAWQERLAERVVERGGLLLSELDPARPPDAWTFPVRNRIVAALARVVVVVEAGHRSGAKNTVSHALRLGREVLALPGPVDAAASAGCLDLIEDGAGMVRGPHTVLRAAGLDAPRAREAAVDPVWAALEDGPTVDGLVARTGLAVGAVLGRLGELELAGRVRRVPGGRWARREEGATPGPSSGRPR